LLLLLLLIIMMMMMMLMMVDNINLTTVTQSLMIFLYALH